METIEYTSSDKSIHIKLEYIVKQKFRNYRHIGKSYPKCTQCLLYYNGLLLNFGEVIKHRNDNDNQAFAYKLATSKALEKLNMKSLRKDIWDLVFEKFGTE